MLVALKPFYISNITLDILEFGLTIDHTGVFNVCLNALSVPQEFVLALTYISSFH